MKNYTTVGAMMALGVFVLAGCEEKSAAPAAAPKEKRGAGLKEKRVAEPQPEEEDPMVAQARERFASRPPEKRDPFAEEIYLFQAAIRPAYNERQFDQLEKRAAELRATKATFANGSWKLLHFYNAFDCDHRDAESLWELHEKIHQEWIAARPDSITARVAYADFLTDYAWKARGGGSAETVTEEGWRLFRQRLGTARQVLRDASKLPEKDPVWGVCALMVALGQGWSKDDYQSLLAELQAAEPKYWGYDTMRAYSLLPRWHGAAGEWEEYASRAADRPGGFGDEIYARIVINQSDFYRNVFQETKASWAKTRAGLELIRQRCPEALDIVSITAKFAFWQKDRELAKAMFERLGDVYYSSVWPGWAEYRNARDWALR